MTKIGCFRQVKLIAMQLFYIAVFWKLDWQCSRWICCLFKFMGCREKCCFNCCYL